MFPNNFGAMWRKSLNLSGLGDRRLTFRSANRMKPWRLSIMRFCTKDGRTNGLSLCLFVFVFVIQNFESFFFRFFVGGNVGHLALKKTQRVRWSLTMGFF